MNKKILIAVLGYLISCSALAVHSCNTLNVKFDPFNPNLSDWVFLHQASDSQCASYNGMLGKELLGEINSGASHDKNLNLTMRGTQSGDGGFAINCNVKLYNQKTGGRLLLNITQGNCVFTDTNGAAITAHNFTLNTSTIDVAIGNGSWLHNWPGTVTIKDIRLNPQPTPTPDTVWGACAIGYDPAPDLNNPVEACACVTGQTTSQGAVDAAVNACRRFGTGTQTAAACRSGLHTVFKGNTHGAATSSFFTTSLGVGTADTEYDAIQNAINGSGGHEAMLLPGLTSACVMRNH